MEEKARKIAIKYVYGNHDALTDEQEVKDMTKDIVDLVKQFEAKNNESLHLVIDCFKCNTIDCGIDRGRICYKEKCEDYSGG